jgi:hypothetical protein
MHQVTNTWKTIHHFLAIMGNPHWKSWKAIFWYFCVNKLSKPRDIGNVGLLL